MGRPQDSICIREKGGNYFIFIPARIFDRFSLDYNDGEFFEDGHVEGCIKTVKELIEWLDYQCKPYSSDKKWNLEYKDYYNNILKPKLLKFKKRSIVK